MSLSILNMSIEDDIHIKRETDIMDLNSSGTSVGCLSPTASKLRDVHNSYKAGKITAEVDLAHFYCLLTALRIFILCYLSPRNVESSRTNFCQGMV
jgi:hypothetical protein